MVTNAFGFEVGKPFIHNFTSKDYRGHTQNWIVEQDTNGVMYFGNQAGVISYDGFYWRTIPIANFSTVRSLALAANGRIYVGAVGDFGYLVPNAAGKMIYHSLVPQLDSSLRDFGNVWNCMALGDQIFFLTDDWLYIYKNNEFKVIPTRGDYFYACFLVGNQVYVHDYGVGLLRYSNDSLHPIPGGNNLDVQSIHVIFPYDEQHFLIGVRNMGFILMDKKTGNLTLLNQKLTDFIAEAELYHAVQLDSTRYALATIRKGVVIIDKEGWILEVINKNAGLQDETVYYLKQTHGVLWAALEKGISTIDWQTSIRFWDEASGLMGSITDMVRFNNQMIVSTGSGVFKLQLQNQGQVSYFESIPEVADQAWDLQKFTIANTTDSMLLVGIGKGLWKITSTNAERVFRGEGVYKIFPSSVHSNRIYLGMMSGLGFVSINPENKKFSDVQLIATFNNEVRDIFENPDGSLWVSLAYKGAALIRPNTQTGNRAAIKRFEAEHGLKVKRELRMFTFQNRLLFSCESGVFNFDTTTQTFVSDTIFTSKFSLQPGLTTFYTHDTHENHWINGRFHYSYFSKKMLEKSKLLNRLPEVNTEFQYVDQNQLLWIGTSEGIYRVNPNQNPMEEHSFKVLLRKVYVKNDSVLFWGDNKLDLIPKIEHRNNFIGFVYTSGYFEKPEDIQYSFILEGYDVDWSEWSVSNKKEFTNLFERTYTFKVKARNYMGTISPETSFTFIIKPPVYRTWYAYLLYLISTVALVVIIVLYRTKKLRNDKIRLESIIRERTLEILRQKDEIETSAISLTRANRELQKLSVIAQKTDNAVAVFDALGNIEWVNEGFTQMFGYTLEEFISEKGNNLMRSSGHVHIADALKECIEKKETIIYQYFTLTRNQQGIWAQTTLTPILDESGNISRIIAIDSDITKIKDAEQEIQHQRDELKKTNETKDKFFSIIAHDLRGPLSNIFTMLNILHSDMDLYDKDQLQTFIGQMKETTGNTFNLTENLLDWAHLRRDSIQYFPKIISIFDLVNENLELFQSQATKKNIRLINKLSEAILVYADEEMIKTIIRNLLGNAIKFTEAEGHVIFDFTEEAEKWWIHVTDTGKGMKKEAIDKLFRIDVHHSTLGTQKEKGSGLGLILIKEFLGKNQGDIRVESQIGKGSTFSFCLPKPTLGSGRAT